MTNKEIYLHHLHQARVGYARWLGVIKLLSAGFVDTAKQNIELNDSEIEFGKWFYQEAMLFGYGTCESTVGEMELLWTEIHSHFIDIYEVCTQKQKNNIFGIKRSLSDRAIKISTVHYHEIIMLSDKLKNALRSFEKQLNAKGEDEFDMFGSYVVAQEHIKKVESFKKDKLKTASIIRVSGARGAYLTE